ncbi:MAG: ATP-binding cassette domain-containing protein [Clostridia bacterium]|nr:ATP-binding cassette domain-containing protein [Clostridia bacterium]
MIVIEHLVKRYGPLTALDDVSIEVGRGEIVGLLGPNGAGKSTAMNILTGYLSASGGRVLVDGVDVLLSPIEAKRKIGYLPEQPPVYPDMTVDEYLAFVYQLKGCTLPREQHLDDVCKAVRITEVRSRLIRNLSKGYRQRVGMAQALIGDPPLLIFDEPTVGLDPKQIIEVRNLLRTLGRRHTVILSTHILSEVQAVCERIVVIDRGRVVANERTEDLGRAVSEHAAYRYRILGPEREVVSELRARHGVARAELLPEREGDAVTVLVECERGVDVRRAVFSLCASKGWPILGLSPVGADLEDIFLRLVSQEK